MRDKNNEREWDLMVLSIGIRVIIFLAVYEQKISLWTPNETFIASLCKRISGLAVPERPLLSTHTFITTHNNFYSQASLTQCSLHPIRCCSWSKDVRVYITATARSKTRAYKVKAKGVPSKLAFKPSIMLDLRGLAYVNEVTRTTFWGWDATLCRLRAHFFVFKSKPQHEGVLLM